MDLGPTLLSQLLSFDAKYLLDVPLREHIVSLQGTKNIISILTVLQDFGQGEHISIICQQSAAQEINGFLAQAVSSSHCTTPA
mgnify:CR=1 FL=1